MGDLVGAERYMLAFPNVKLNIYTVQFGYSPYNSGGTLDTRFVKGDDGVYRFRR
jgi:hypothetical protein